MMIIHKDTTVKIEKFVATDQVDLHGTLYIDKDRMLTADLANIYKGSKINNNVFDGDYNFINPTFSVSSNGELSIVASGEIVDLTYITY